MTLGSAPLIAAAVAALAISAAAIGAVRASQAQQVRAARVSAAIKPYRRSVAASPGMRYRLLQSAAVTRLRPRLAALLAIRLERVDEYPVQWWIGLIGTALVARLIVEGAHLLLGFDVLPAVLPLWVVLSRLLFLRFEARRRVAIYQQFPDTLSMIVRALRVGQTVTDALRSVAREAQPPTNLAFSLLADRMAIGLPLSDALTEMARDVGIPEYRFFATTLLLQAQTGGSLTEALENLADVIRGRVALRRRAHALASEARASAYVLGALPILTGGMLMVVAPDYGRMLFDDPTGRRVLAGAIFLLVFGSFVMSGMIRKMLG